MIGMWRERACTLHSLGRYWRRNSIPIEQLPLPVIEPLMEESFRGQWFIFR